MGAILVADCLSCGHTESLEAARIFEFDTRCPECGELLVLQEEEGEEEDEGLDWPADEDELSDPREIRELLLRAGDSFDRLFDTVPAAELDEAMEAVRRSDPRREFVKRTAVSREARGRRGSVRLFNVTCTS